MHDVLVMSVLQLGEFGAIGPVEFPHVNTPPGSFLDKAYEWHELGMAAHAHHVHPAVKHDVSLAKGEGSASQSTGAASPALARSERAPHTATTASTASCFNDDILECVWRVDCS